MPDTDNELALIKRETANLVAANSFSAESDLEALYARSREILTDHLKPGRPAAEDPELALKMASFFHKANIEILETKRKVLDTAIRARSLFTETPPNALQPNEVSVTPTEGSGGAENGPFAEL